MTSRSSVAQQQLLKQHLSGIRVITISSSASTATYRLEKNNLQQLNFFLFEEEPWIRLLISILTKNSKFFLSCHFWFRFFKNFLFIKKQTTHFALPTKCQSVFVWSTSKPKKGWSTFATTQRRCYYWYYKWHQSKINCKINNVDDDDSEHPIIVLSWICDCLFWSQKRLHRLGNHDNSRLWHNIKKKIWRGAGFTFSYKILRYHGREALMIGLLTYHPFEWQCNHQAAVMTKINELWAIYI